MCITDITVTRQKLEKKKCI